MRKTENRIEIRNLKDEMDRINFSHLETCASCGHIETQEVTIFRPRFDDYEGNKTQWCVIFSGAIDYEGNKRDMLKRYPEFRHIAIDL